MSSENPAIANPDSTDQPKSLLMPQPTVAPMVLALGLALLALGVVASPAILIVSGLIIATGLGIWISALLPGHGHFHEELSSPANRPGLIEGKPGSVEQLRSGMPGYRLQLPVQFHPISAGIKGGIVGGIVMTIPALSYGVLSGHGLWYPANLLAGIALPAVERLSIAEIEQFQPSLLVAAIVIHAINSVVFGMIYGVLMPTLPHIPRPLAWGGLLIPALWTVITFSLMGLINPLMRKGVDWPWFIASQFVFGVIAAGVVMWSHKERPLVAGLRAGAIGGLLMPIPAMMWGLLAGHSVWYPANLLAGMVLPKLGQLPLQDLKLFNSEWLAIAIVIHVVMSISIGIIFALVLPKLGPIPTPVTWGGVLMPLLWTSVSFCLMGIVNPLLQARVDWPWFIASQFVFGLAASIMVVRSEKVYTPLAGRGPDPRAVGISAGGGPNS